MKTLFRCFIIFIRQIAGDSMLFAILLAPLLAGSFFRFGIPQIEILLCGYFSRNGILTDYYLLFDLLLATLTPFMFCFASAMVILTEIDENIVRYIAVTPVGKRGYLISRLVFPAGISAVCSVLMLHFFSLTDITLVLKLIVCVMTAIMSVSANLMIITFSHNRVEGMALGKITGLLMLGLPIPFFLISKMKYAVSFLSSFWIAELAIENNLLYAIPALFISVVMIGFLYQKFQRKIL